VKTVHGSCECERVRIEATLDLEGEGTFKCNCQICRKTGFWGASVATLRVLSGEGDLAKYGDAVIHHFCRHCGVKIFGRVQKAEGPPTFAVSVRVLDDLDLRELKKAKIMYVDGLHDRFDREPEFKELL
jgi:hypothetical protein